HPQGALARARRRLSLRRSCPTRRSYAAKLSRYEKIRVGCAQRRHRVRVAPAGGGPIDLRPLAHGAVQGDVAERRSRAGARRLRPGRPPLLPRLEPGGAEDLGAAAAADRSRSTVEAALVPGRRGPAQGAARGYGRGSALAEERVSRAP